MNEQILHLRNEMDELKNLLAAVTQRVIPQLDEGNAHRTAQLFSESALPLVFFFFGGGVKRFLPLIEG